ncbi:hypothetical protein [Lichenifustis flavocetrariae]|uniref:Uncharacterized protein n=1 Tax=Lichenifustis flavocetrariae TaxID=2949735 RepID=A0AA41Z771_9HYPH|nr:hypothetical protein [Lichenifustis flavocetrariae]MCW6511590.1 hypothetical protein [Lichenifustis flavocetrariae]
MRSEQPVPPVPMASDLTDVIFAQIQQHLECHDFEQGRQFLLRVLLHPLPDGARPATLGAVEQRLSDRDALMREIEAITPETGAAHHRLGMRVQYSLTNYRLSDVMTGMVAQAVAVVVCT